MDPEGVAARATEPEEFDSEIRPLAYAMINSFIVQHSIISEAVNMRPAKMLVYLVIVAATVQRLMREPDMSAEFRAGAKIPPAEFGTVSRRAIAAATRLPNENVRRLVKELIADGLVMAGPNGGVRNTGGNLQNPRMRLALRHLLAEKLRTYELIARTDVVGRIGGD